MSVVSVVGLQWGDEGKGKIVDFLAEEAEIVVRFQGGHNAGHTILVNGVEYKLSILPSSIIRKGKISVIGNGVVIDPFHFENEVNKLRSQNIEINPENLYVADNAILILPIHQQLDRIQESLKKGDKIGTTGRGIGPAYSDKISRRALRIADLKYPEIIKAKLEEMGNFYAPIFAEHKVELKLEETYTELMKIREFILPFMRTVWLELKKFKAENKKILFEGAQGVMLDIDHGTYPYVTSSNTITGQAIVGSGLGAADIAKNIGVVKAYTTRVGEGPMPSELQDDTGDFLQKIGNEFGTVTGRTRRCGWLDAVQLSQMINISGINSIALTKLDVLSGLKEIKITTKYILEDQEIDYLPSCLLELEKVKPVFETLPGFSDDFSKVKSLADFSENALNFINRLETLLQTKIDIISFSPKREDTIINSALFKA